MEIDGVTGTCGPNDNGYINGIIRDAAKHIKNAQELYSQGHYPHSNAKLIPLDHPLRISLDELAKHDKETCYFANKEHDVELFTTYEPLLEDQTRWDDLKYKGVEGSN